ncbi:MAG: hypothetical protein M5U22_17340 [Thermoleophilia bacterium]|nr:hypothetical protein [Thermoleophilia bacterium]
MALFPAVTGPMTLASHLGGPAFWIDLEETPERAYRTLETAGQVMLRVARQYLDMGFEQLVVSDPLLGRVDPAHYPRVASVLRSLWNVADFYEARVLLQTEVNDAARVEELLGLGAGGLLVEGGVPLGSVSEQAGRRDQRLAAGLPAALLEGGAGDLAQALSAWRTEVCPPGSLAACCSIPRTAPPENVHEVARLLRA